MSKTLLLFSLKGNKLAARKEDVEKIRSIDNVTRLPFSYDGTTDIALIDNRMTYLFDLSACVGFGSTDRGKINSALILSGGNGTSGFGVEGDIDQLEVTPNELIPLPDCLKTDLIATCMSDGSKPVPVIDLAALHQELQQKGLEELEMELELPETDPDVAEPSNGYRTYTCCGYPFTLSGQITETVQVQGQQIAKVPFAPRWVEGLMFGDSRVIPLIRLSDCLDLEASSPAALTIVLNVGGQYIGLLVDSAGSVVADKSTQMVPMPALAASPPMCQALLCRQEILPCISPFTLLRTLSERSPTQSLSNRYTLGTEFRSLNFGEGVDLIEINLNDRKYAIPDCETTVCDSHSTVFKVPTTSPVVVGLAQYEGAILPVIDLALYIGRESHPKSEGRMIHISNGDFQALLMVDEVLGSRRLEASLMRELPMKLSADLVYGCYLDGDTVALILNVAVMALNSEQLTGTVIQGALTAIGAAQTPVSEQTEVAAQSKSAEQIKSAMQIKLAQPKKPAGQIKPAAQTRAQESIPIMEACDQPRGEPEGRLEGRLETAQKTALGSEFTLVSTLENRDTQERILEGEAEGEPLPENGVSETEEKAAKGVESSGKLRSERKPIRYALFSLLFVCILGTGYFLRTEIFLRPGSFPRKESFLKTGSVPGEDLSAPGDREPGDKSEPESVKNDSGIAFVPAHDDNREASYLVNFPPDSPVIPPGERANLIKVAAVIERNPPDRITITGHTARLGTEESCLILSKVRAEAVRDLLLAYSSFEEKRITTWGAGASRPVANNLTPTRMAENRRAEIHLGY